jgi:predicted GIY-YIG superfamily endonuclease
MSYIIYLLINTYNNYTYVGITNNITRRLRQHNGIIKGGARYTSNMKSEGEWILYGFIEDVDKHNALSLEKKIHLRTKKGKGSSPLERRLNVINELIKDTEYKFVN